MDNNFNGSIRGRQMDRSRSRSRSASPPRYGHRRRFAHLLYVDEVDMVERRRQQEIVDVIQENPNDNNYNPHHHSDNNAGDINNDHSIERLTEMMEKLKMITRCHICHGTMEDARTNVCGHSACFTCWNTWLTGLETAGRTPFCGMCRNPFTSLTTSLALNDLISTIRDYQND